MVGLQLIIEYNKKHPQNNIIWLCEQKSILLEKFDSKCIKDRGFSDITKESIPYFKLYAKKTTRLV